MANSAAFDKLPSSLSTVPVKLNGHIIRSGEASRVRYLTYTVSSTMLRAVFLYQVWRRQQLRFEVRFEAGVMVCGVVWLVPSVASL
ncbi:hypothetical protein CDL15_Pgr010879 [Punica granatum]|uniref:Uncharacterized protein n=1 Tax=Punica granatum TaxID=22663 RepID=A0A218W6T0_PUNGR|nr:hypothetical protein CDL15_Pgr010879 [Punica granatum]